MIKYVNRFENWLGTGEDMYIVFYTSGRSRSFRGWDNLPKSARRFIAAAKNFEFRKNYAGTFYHRFS